MNRNETSIAALEKDLATIKDALNSGFNDVLLPENLKSENFLKLLPDKKVFDFKNILKINRLVPILSTVAAAALLITVVSRIGVGNHSTLEPEMTSPAVAGASTMIVQEAGVEDGVARTEFGADVVNTPEAQDADVPLVQPQTGGPRETSVAPKNSSAAELREERVTDVSDVAVGDYTENESVAVGGSAPAFVLAETELHTFFWRSAVDDPNFSQYNAVLEVVDNQSNEIYVKVGLPDIYSVLNVVVGKDTVYVVGTTNVGLEILDFTGLTTGTLIHSGTYTVEGSVKNRYQQDGYLYIASTVSDGSVKVSVYDYEVEESTDSGVGIITVIDGGMSTIDMEYINGIDSSKVYRNGSMFIFNSTTENAEKVEVKATLNHGIVLFE